MAGQFEEEYPETPWFSLGVEEFQMVVELTGCYRVRTFEGHHLVGTDDVEALWAALVRVMAVQGFSLRGV